MNRLWRRLPPEWRILIHEYRALIVAVILFGFGAVAVVVFVTPDRHIHAGFLPAQTISTFDHTTDSGVSIRGVVRLPDGTSVNLSTSSLVAAQWFASNTCVEKRQRDSGTVFYRLAAPANCLP